MEKRFLNVSLLIISILFIFSPLQVAAHGHTQSHSQPLSHSAVQLKDHLHKLWIDHTLWTRSYITSALVNLEDQDKVLARLLKNQENIGNAIKPYYGEKAAQTLSELLKQHILIGGKVVEAAKTGNQPDLEKYNKEWYKNADDMAKFLSSANPNWSDKVLKEMLHKHLDFVTKQLVARIHKDWDADILAFDQGEDHMVHFADTLAEGIIKQFPKRFQ
ncbi:MAG TPA: glycosyltransferase [Bacillota bacterium]|nr:glycosyltransferase [Bacillota bacterium]